MCAGMDHVVLPLVWVRFARWQTLLQLTPADLDPSHDGVPVPEKAKPFSKVSALA